MSFSFETSEQQQLRAFQTNQTTNSQKLILKQQQEEDTRRQADKPLEDARIDLARRKAQDKVNKERANFESGVVDPEEAKNAERARARADEAGMTDFQRYSQKNDYDLNNQTKAWESANKLRMSEADQSNVAQKDRLVSQLDNQKNMQQSGFNQTNKLRTDDNRRAIDGFKMNF